MAGKVREDCKNEREGEVRKCNMLILLRKFEKIREMVSDSPNSLKSLRNLKI
jgi:hypothetical protein